MESDSLTALIQLALSNLPVFLIVVVLLVGTGSGGTAAIQGLMASRRGIKGDALVKEKNSIDGFIGLSTIQETTITRQENTIINQGHEIDTLKARVDELDSKLSAAIDKLEEVSNAYRHEIDYSNLLAADRIAHGLPAIARPYVITTVVTDVHTETSSIEKQDGDTIEK